MALPDDINPDPADIPETAEFQGPPLDISSADQNLPDAIQASDEVEDMSFAELTNVTTQEFKANNPAPVGDAEITSIPDVMVPPPETPIDIDDTPRATPLRDSTKSYQQRRDDFNSMKAATSEEFKRKQGTPPPAENFPLGEGRKEALGEATIAYHESKSDSTNDAGKDNSNPVQDFVEADQANRTEIGELLGAHARWIDQHTRLLESQRL